MFAVPGSGNYKLQPVYVEDLAEIAINAADSNENLEIDAVGPETFSFNEMVKMIAYTVHPHAKIVHVNARLALSMSGMVGKLVNDVVLTRDEVEGLLANLLVSNTPPTGHTRLSDWLKENADKVGTHYISELAKHNR
jgi:NADH dehydrogenase